MKSPTLSVVDLRFYDIILGDFSHGASTCSVSDVDANVRSHKTIQLLVPLGITLEILQNVTSLHIGPGICAVFRSDTVTVGKVCKLDQLGKCCIFGR